MKNQNHNILLLKQIDKIQKEQINMYLKSWEGILRKDMPKKKQEFNTGTKTLTIMQGHPIGEVSRTVKRKK